MKTYLFTLTHDLGTLRIRVTASSRKRAIAMLMTAEGCPRRAIK